VVRFRSILGIAPVWTRHEDQRPAIRCASAHDRKLRLTAKRSLSHPPVKFTGEQALAIARGFAAAIDESVYVILACSILPEHVHLVVQRHERPVEKLMGHLKARATQQLVAQGLHPFAHLKGIDGRFPSVWADRSWKVFLDSPKEIARAINYVIENPIKEGKKAQHWSFITPKV